jgi:cobalt-zinc-cadmium efflux system protein
MPSHHHHNTTRNIKVAFILNLVFTIIEIAGAIYTNSIAILSDALHDLGDSIGLGLSWFLEDYSRKKRDNRYTYGYARFSLLAAFINGAVLLIGSIFILTEAIPRLLNPVQPDAKGMIILAIIGIIFNGAAVLRLSGGQTQNEKIVTWHLMEDVLGWLAILIGAIIMVYLEAPIIDAIISVVFTLFILYNVSKNFINTSRIFLQAKPENIDLDPLRKEISEIGDVISSHDYHLWSMDGEHAVLTIHAVVPDECSVEAMKVIKKDIRNLCHKYQVGHVTIEIEFESENCELEEC